MGEDTQQYKIHVREEETEQLLMSQDMNWRPCVGVSVRGFRCGPHLVSRVTPHGRLKDVWVVWVKRERKDGDEEAAGAQLARYGQMLARLNEEANGD
jgi:hypothetical protein